MIKICKNSKIGKIFQFSCNLSYFIERKFLIIQTQGTPIPGAFLCPYDKSVLEILEKEFFEKFNSKIQKHFINPLSSVKDICDDLENEQNLDTRKDIVIAPITGLEMSDELISRLRILLCRGINVYVFTKNKSKLWFSDVEKYFPGLDLTVGD